MTQVTLRREARAEQWPGDIERLPEGAHVCQPEVHWSASRELIYFTYADLRSRDWIDAKPRALPAPEKLDFMCSGIRIKRKDGSEYWRQVYPFAFWDAKSESSIKRDWRAVYLDRADADLVETFLDYASTQGWTNPLPPRAEFRIVSGAYGRGFRPVYLKPDDWLVFENGREPCAMSPEAFRAQSFQAA